MGHAFVKLLIKFVVLMDNINLRDSEVWIRGSINFVKANYILQIQSVREGGRLDEKIEA